MTVVNQLVTVHATELKFQFEVGKQSYCDLKVTNNTEHHVGFKVKTTSPKKYYVRPNTGVIHPWDSCVIRVTLEAQKECPPDMQCKDKFLLQTTVVPPTTQMDQSIPQNTFNKESGNIIEECKLKVIYVSTQDKLQETINQTGFGFSSNHALRRAQDERDAAVRQTQLLQKDLETLKGQRSHRSVKGFSIRFSLLVGLIGIITGFLINLLLSSPSTK